MENIPKDKVTHRNIHSIELLIKKVVDETWRTDNFPMHLGLLAKGIKDIVEKIVELGDSFYEGMQEEESEDVLEAYIFHYVWAEEAKSFLILARDIFFEEQKAFVLVQDGKISPVRLEEQKGAAQEALLQKAKEVVAVFDSHKSRINKEKSEDKNLAKWKQQQNPWLIYQEQFLRIPEQVERIQEEHQILLNIADSFRTTRSLIQKTLKSCAVEVKSNNLLAVATIEYIEESDADKVGRIAQFLEEREATISSPNLLNEFSAFLEKELNSFPQKQKVHVESIEGILYYKEIPFKYNTRLWLDSEVLPLIYEVWELIEKVRNGIKMALVNIHNRVVLLSSENKEPIGILRDKNITLPLKSFLKNATHWVNEVADISKLINERIDKSFHIVSIYSAKQDFLPLPLQSTINQFKLNQNSWVSGIGSWVKHQVGALKQFKSQVRHEDTLSTSEKVVRFIKNRTDDGTNSQYANIFLTKGYIGESFWVGRTTELNHVESIIEQWKYGFRGAAIISGQRFSGKSLMGELVANRFFPRTSVRLSPGTPFVMQGRRFTPSYDLGEALDFIRKHTLDAKPLILIDDLELWGDPTNCLSKNVRVLCNFMDVYSRKMFFMVTMGNALKNHLEKTHQIHKVFQAEINLDYMSKDEISQAILIRHGATHKTLVDKDNKEIQPQQFRKMAARVYSGSQGNIGEALNRWSLYTERVDEERVLHSFKTEHSLPDFIQPDTALLLAAITMEKRTMEYHLRKLFGPPFKEKYGSILQRLISVGLIERHMDSWLEINEVAANDIGRMLEQKEYLTFSHK